MERFRPVPEAQHQSLHGVGLPRQLPREVTRQIPLGTQEAATPSTGRTHEGGRHLRGPKEGCAEATSKREEEELLYFGGNVETCRQESLQATEEKVSVKDSEAEPSNSGKPQRGQEKESR